MSPDEFPGKPLSLAQACARLRFRHLQFLDILGRTRNLRLTAEQMHVTQPAATKILMDIEEILEAKGVAAPPAVITDPVAAEAARRALPAGRRGQY